MTEQALTETDQILISMLKQDTGRHILDSGGAQGRWWQQNQERDFRSEPEATIDLRWGIEVTFNTYHWLRDRLDYDKEMDTKFRRYVSLFCDEDTTWFEVAEQFIQALTKKGKAFTITTANTYNEGSLVQQDYQYTRWVDDYDTEYYMLFIHNGADARGGYTAPRIFQGKSGEMWDLAFQNHGHVWCTGKAVNLFRCENGHEFRIPDSVPVEFQTTFCPECGSFKLNHYGKENVSHVWDTEDGYHWYWYDEGRRVRSFDNDEFDLQEMEKKEIEGPEAWVPIGEDGVPVLYWYRGEDGKGVGLCPFDGTRLEAGFY